MSTNSHSKNEEILEGNRNEINEYADTFMRRLNDGVLTVNHSINHAKNYPLSKANNSLSAFLKMEESDNIIVKDEE